MTVTATGDRLRFIVTSEGTGGQEEYFIDMDAQNGNGYCTCRDYACRCEPQLIKNGHAVVNHGNTGRTRCKHINAVILHLGQLVVGGARKHL